LKLYPTGRALTKDALPKPGVEITPPPTISPEISEALKSLDTKTTNLGTSVGAVSDSITALRAEISALRGELSAISMVGYVGILLTIVVLAIIVVVMFRRPKT
ncbi:MAG: hypothetical protein QXU67_01990, partial [Candidatus Bathyarchaeia archaeon]